MDRTRKSLNVCQVNARSLCAPSRLLDLEIFSANHAVDVLCITETWLTNSKSSQSISLPGFQLPFQKDHNIIVSPGDGVATYVRTDIAARIIPIPDNKNIEVICIQLMISCRVKLDVISAYCPPGPNAEVFFQQLDEVIDVVQGPNQTALCIVGDFNAKTSDF